MGSTKYCAFISYRHQSPDQEIAKALHTAIETYGIPASIRKKNGIRKMGKVFRDQEELPLSSDLGGDIETALDNSEWFIAICSPRYLQSKWCLREMEYFIEHKGRDHVLTVLTEGEPADSFPEMIRFSTDEQGVKKEVEPRAGDVRAEGLPAMLKKLKEEKLRLLAPMLGLTFDDLKRRARQRKIRIISVISAISLVVATGTATFLVINHERQEALKREAEHQAQIAEEQRKIAEEQTKLAEEKERVAAEQTKLAENNKKLADEQTKLAEDNKKLADEQTKIAEEQTRIAEEKDRVAAEQTKLAEDNKKLADEQTKLAEDNAKLAEDNAKLAEEQRKIAEEQTRIAEEKDRVAAEQTKLAEDNAKLAEEQQQLANEQRRLAVSNEIGELLQKAEVLREKEERVLCAQTLLEALKLSDGEDRIRREEILTILRKNLSFIPFTTISGFNNQNARLLYMTVSPDGKKAAGVENQDSVALLDFAANEMVYKVSTGTSQIVNVQFSPDGSRFLAQYGSHVSVWNTADGSEVFTYRAERGGDFDINFVSFWRDSGTILVMDWDQFHIVSLADGTDKVIYTLGDQMDWYSMDDNIYTQLTGSLISQILTPSQEDYQGVGVAVAEDWSKILIGGKVGETGTILIDEDGRTVTPIYGMPGTMMEEDAISPDGKTVLTMSMIGIGFAWDADTGDLLYLCNFYEEGAANYLLSNVSFSPDSQRFAIVVNNVLHVYDTRSGFEYLSATIDDTVYTPSVCFSSDGNYLLLLNQAMFIINARTWQVERMENTEEWSPYNTLMALDKTVLAGTLEGKISIMAMPELASIWTQDSSPGPLQNRYYPGIAPEGAVEPQGEHFIIQGYWAQHNDLPEDFLQPRKQYSRDGKTTAVLYPDGAIELFETFGDGKPVRSLAQLMWPIVSFGMVNDRLIATDYSGRMLFYDLETKEVVRIHNGVSPYTGYAFNEEGTLMMALRNGGGYTIDVYETATGDMLFSMTSTVTLISDPQAFEPFTEFAFTEDGEYAVGVTENSFVIADLLKDETRLIERAEMITSLYQEE